MINLRNFPMIAVAAGACLLTACERPPVETEQIGYRGTGMVEVENPRLAHEAVEIPDAIPPAPQAGPRAGDVLQNVQVLGDLSVAEFTRTMTAITAWVSPEEGCNYCHVEGNFAAEGVYTKTVSRRMLQMTSHINNDWEQHVGDTGVTCYTCHLGKPVPEHIWFEDNSEANASNYAGNRAGQNMASASVGLTSLPADPYSELLTDTDNMDIRVVGTDPFPGEGGTSIPATEKTFGLMIHMSNALGVNCAYCHNSNNFGSWSQSTPQRVTAYHGLNMVKDLNQNYLIPLQSTYPEERLGDAGDAPKAYCTTCHAGQAKPLGGAAMASDYPAVWRPE